MDSNILAEAAKRWGTPLYLTDLDAAADNLATYQRNFPGALIAYAVKANSDPQLLRRLVAEGAGAEVVNEVELALAIRAGCPPERMVMNGVGKTDSDLRMAVRAAADGHPPRWLAVESADEVARLIDLARLVARLTGAEIDFVENPRNEAAENDLYVENRQLLDLGLVPITLEDGLLNEVTQVAEKYAHRCDRDKIPARSLWRQRIATPAD